MVVVAIIGILAAIATPDLLSMLRNSRTKSDIRDIYSAIQYARMAAVKENQDADIVFDVTAKTYTVSVGVNTRKSGTLHPTSDLYTNLTGNSFSFNSRGMSDDLSDATALSTESTENQFPCVFIHQIGAAYYLRCRISYGGSVSTQISTDGTTWH